MNVRCDRRALLDVATLVGSVVPSRTTRPILQNLLLVARDGVLELQGTDLEMAARCSVPLLECSEEGSLTLPATRLLNILREIGGESVDLSTDGLVAVIRGGSSQFHLSGEHPDEFPDVHDGSDVKFAEIPCDTFRALTQRTEFAASKELGRYAINGILLELDGKTVRCVATDGRRLALAEQQLEHEIEGPTREILPLRAVNQFARSLGPGVETVGLGMHDKQVLLRGGTALFTAAAVEADFPDHRMVIDHKRDRLVHLERDAFFSAVRQAAVMAGEDARSVNLEFSEGSLVVESQTEGLGDARSELAIDYTGEKVTICFNPDFLLDFAKVDVPEQLPFRFGDHAVSALFEPFEGFQYVVMPVTT